MVLVPLLMHRVRMSEKETFATSVAVILPICAVSLAAHMLQSGFVLFAALPYMAGGAAFAVLGALLAESADVWLLKKLFGAFLIYAGASLIFSKKRGG